MSDGELCSQQENARSGFSRLAKCARTPKNRARRAAKKRARVEPEHVVELPRLDELPQYDDDEEVISD